MRYILILSVLAIMGILMYLQFTSSTGIFSPDSQVQYKDIEPAVGNMQNKIDTYNEKLNESIGTIDRTF